MGLKGKKNTILRLSISLSRISENEIRFMELKSVVEMSDDDLESIPGNSICQMAKIFGEKKKKYTFHFFLSRNEYRSEKFSESNLEFFASFQEMGRKKKEMEAKW